MLSDRIAPRLVSLALCVTSLTALSPAQARPAGGLDLRDASGDVVVEGRASTGRDHVSLPVESIDLRRVTWAVRGDRLVVRTRLADVLRPHATGGWRSAQRVLSVLDLDGPRVVRFDTRVVGRGIPITVFNYPAECRDAGARIDYDRNIVVQWVATDCLDGAMRARVVSRVRLQVENRRSGDIYRGWVDDVPVRRLRVSA